MTEFLLMSGEQREELLTGLRERRLRLRQVYEQVQDDKRRARAENVTVQIQKKLTQFHKKLTKVDTDIEDLEGRLSQIQALTLQMSDLLGE